MRGQTLHAFPRGHHVVAGASASRRFALQHHLSSAVSFDAILQRVKAKYVLGLTATPIRRDGPQPIIFMQCGPIRHTAAKPANAPHDLEVISQI